MTRDVRRWGGRVPSLTKKEAERQREAEEDHKLLDMEAALENEKLKFGEKERGRKGQLTSPRTCRPESHRSRTSRSSKSSKRIHRRSRSGAKSSDGKGRGNDGSRGSR